MKRVEKSSIFENFWFMHAITFTKNILKNKVHAKKDYRVVIKFVYFKQTTSPEKLSPCNKRYTIEDSNWGRMRQLSQFYIRIPKSLSIVVDLKNNFNEVDTKASKFARFISHSAVNNCTVTKTMWTTYRFYKLLYLNRDWNEQYYGCFL